jgi:signal transduction histidine kinase
MTPSYTQTHEDISALASWPWTGHEDGTVLVHALRTPMTSLKGAVDLLDARILGPIPDALADLVAIAQRNADRLARLIEDLLLLGDIGAGRIAFETRPVALDALVRDGIARWRTQARAARWDAVVIGRMPELAVAGDAEWLARALARVLAAVLDGASARRPARIEAWATADRIAMYCQGLARSQRGLAGGDGQHAVDLSAGLGIGIGIARHVIAAHGGSLDYVDEGPGSVAVRITLPSMRDVTAAPVPAVAFPH